LHWRHLDFFSLLGRWRLLLYEELLQVENALFDPDTRVIPFFRSGFFPWRKLSRWRMRELAGYQAFETDLPF